MHSTLAVLVLCSLVALDGTGDAAVSPGTDADADRYRAFVSQIPPGPGDFELATSRGLTVAEDGAVVSSRGCVEGTTMDPSRTGELLVVAQVEEE